MLTNYMTTVPGIVALIGVLIETWQTKTLNWDHFQGALLALGLIAAKDWNVTGGDRSL